jgi:hypothetical protein
VNDTVILAETGYIVVLLRPILPISRSSCGALSLPAGAERAGSRASVGVAGIAQAQ